MIKTSELRIGNFVNEKNYGFREVIRLDSRDGYDNIYSDPYGYAHGGLIKPIPLTEEWLLKFGFHKAELTLQNQYFKDLKEEDVYLMITSDLYYWIGFDFNSNEDLSIGNGKINYVHQLQNLYFALTGDDLKINK